jgi:hypothetical protein
MGGITTGNTEGQCVAVGTILRYQNTDNPNRIRRTS